MKARLIATFLVLCTAPLLAQAPASASAPAPAPAPATQTHASDLGFSYSLPTDWQVIDSSASLPAVQQQVTKNAATEDEKKGIGCVQIALTARHGTPATVVVVVGLPFDCFGQQMTSKDLPGFATGASEGLKQTFDISDPVYGAYSLGTHDLWIERAKGIPKGHPESLYTVEIACSLLKKGAVCWMTMAADDEGLKTFEHGAVTLDGEAPAALVPTTAFDKKP
jgi:hypothetical protein